MSTAKWLIDVPKRGSDFQSKVLFDSEGCHTTLRQNFSNYSPFDTAYLTRRLESSKLSVRNTGCTVLTSFSVTLLCFSEPLQYSKASKK